MHKFEGSGNRALFMLLTVLSGEARCSDGGGVVSGYASGWGCPMIIFFTVGDFGEADRHSRFCSFYTFFKDLVLSTCFLRSRITMICLGHYSNLLFIDFGSVGTLFWLNIIFLMFGRCVSSKVVAMGRYLRRS